MVVLVAFECLWASESEWLCISKHQSGFTDTQILPSWPWLIALCTVSQPWLTSPLCNGLLTRIGTDCAFRKESVISSKLYLSERRSHRDARDGSWKCSLPPQTGLAFHVWLLLGRFACRNAGTAPHPPKYDPWSNNQTSSYAWHHHKMVYYNT